MQNDAQKTNLKSNGFILDTGYYSGGGEALYQLAVDLKKFGYNIKIAYKGVKPFNPPRKFNKYLKELDVVLADDVKNKDDSFIIVPESDTESLFDFPLYDKYIWWLSFNYYDGLFFSDPHRPTKLKFIKTFIKYILYIKKKLLAFAKYGHTCFPIKDVHNISGSYYISKMLASKMHVEFKELIHSIGKDFLNYGVYDGKGLDKRQDIVLYNPAKPSDLMAILLRRGNFHYIPVRNLSFQQMIDLFRKSKLYLDFGFFPGPERLPKETVFNGANVLVARRNAALTKDVLIPEKYKIEIDSDPQEVEGIIKEMLNNYDKDYKDFNEFRMYILNMEQNYYKQLEQIFPRIK
ncbi:UDP-galactopyranose mutase [Bifidobacterium hapali]|uniref:UDP-galactopyranose mutase n=1 Tax=Bifidobacterium hapali TaxID=1630172 RepID=A0A261G1U4_9BIFI|nr:hypothetical protein [Bifidobacterium hapali]OZG65390.1 UDP-galactopyranose mutase [Bifidobacterium hapali]